MREFVYTNDHQANRIVGFAVHPLTGELTPVPGPLPTVPQPRLVVGDSARGSVYVASDLSTLARLNVDAATGALVPTAPISVTGFPEQGGALHPLLPVVYMTDPATLAVRAYRVDEPCCIVHLGAAPIANTVHGAAVHPSGRFLYATTVTDGLAGNSSHLWGFAIDPATGLLTPLAGSPWLEGVDKRTTEVAIESSGRYLYAVNQAAHEITGYAIDAASGALTRLPSAPFPAGGISNDLTLTDSGRFLYATLGALGQIAAFAIGADGTLTPVPGSPYATDTGPWGLVTAGDDRFLYVAAGVSSLLAYAIDPVSGALAARPGPSFPGLIQGQYLTRVRMRQDLSTATLSIDDVSVAEGDSGSVSATFTVELSGPSAQPVIVAYATAPGTAQTPSDFASVSGTLTFAPGVVEQQVSVPVLGDAVDEPDEVFFVQFQSITGASLADSDASTRIVDDDGAGVRVSALERNSDLVADLQARPGPAADEDLYLVRRDPWSSYEIVLDEASGDLGRAGPDLHLLSGDLAVLAQSSPVGAGHARALRFDNDASVPRLDYVRVRSAGCTLTCGPDDTYRLRMRETTGRIARFNDRAGRFTVLVLQNGSETSVTAHVSYWGENGTRLASAAVALAPRESKTVPTPVTAVGESGSVTVSHDGPLGALSGKAVSLDPANGLSFDSPLTTRPR